MKEPNLVFFYFSPYKLKESVCFYRKLMKQILPCMMGSLKPSEGMKHSYFSITIHFLQISTFHNSEQSTPGAPRLCSWFQSPVCAQAVGGDNSVWCAWKFLNIGAAIGLAAGFTLWMVVWGEAGVPGLWGLKHGEKSALTARPIAWCGAPGEPPLEGRSGVHGLSTVPALGLSRGDQHCWDMLEMTACPQVHRDAEIT